MTRERPIIEKFGWEDDELIIRRAQKPKKPKEPELPQGVAPREEGAE